MGLTRSLINQIAKRHKDAWVHFDDDGNPVKITYQRTFTVKAKQYGID